LTLEHLSVRFCPWSRATEAEQLADADIGVSWLPDDAWSRGKCALKVLQYMAAGLPALANPVGMQAELVKPGRTGYLASTAAEWIDAIRALASSTELRLAMGDEARRGVNEAYGLALGTSRWLELLDEMPTTARSQVCRRP
jgi:glycosyltransferase involved in cell wall biosynthesis